MKPQKKAKLVAAIVLGKKDLDEMAKIADSLSVPVMDRSYRQVQQALVIASLIDFLKSYGIRVPFELGGETTNE